MDEDNTEPEWRKIIFEKAKSIFYSLQRIVKEWINYKCNQFSIQRIFQFCFILIYALSSVIPSFTDENQVEVEWFKNIYL